MGMIKQRGSIMPAIFDLLYREYCRARLTEMRKQLLIRPESQELPEANCDVGEPNGAADPGGDRNETDHGRQIRHCATAR